MDKFLENMEELEQEKDDNNTCFGFETLVSGGVLRLQPLIPAPKNLEL